VLDGRHRVAGPGVAERGELLEAGQVTVAEPAAKVLDLDFLPTPEGGDSRG
jgi:hypothetical protein